MKFLQNALMNEQQTYCEWQKFAGSSWGIAKKQNSNFFLSLIHVLLCKNAAIGKNCSLKKVLEQNKTK